MKPARRPWMSAVAAGGTLIIVALATSPALAGARSPVAQPAGPDRADPEIAVLCYHSVTNDPEARFESVTPDSLRAHIRRMRENGWTFMSVSNLLARRERPDALPARTAVLVFDDGYLDFYQNALPILRREKVPAALAVITGFVGNQPAELPPMMSWKQIREVDKSELVEVISHSHGLHRWEVCNPYGNRSTSGSTRIYDTARRHYESLDEYRDRIRADLKEARQVLARELGHPVDVVAWPYGDHNDLMRELAKQEGYRATLGLGGGGASLAQLRSGYLPRVMVLRDMIVGSSDLEWLDPPRFVVKAVDVDMDALYEAGPKDLEASVTMAVERAKSAGANTVFLQACPDPSRDRRYRDAWFVNHQIPVRADVLSMVAMQFAHERIRVWVKAPTLNMAWAWEAHPEWRIAPGKGRGSRARFRVSPDLDGVRRAARDFYTDLAVYLPIDGILFDDDATMARGERLSGTPSDDPAIKTAAIDKMLEEIKTAVRVWRPDCRFGRVLDPATLDREGPNRDVAQDFDRALSSGEFVVIPVDPFARGYANVPVEWARQLSARAAKRTCASRDSANRPAVVFQLQARDPAGRRWLSVPEMEAMARKIRRAGFRDLGVAPLTADQGNFPAGLLNEPDTKSGLAVRN